MKRTATNSIPQGTPADLKAKSDNRRKWCLSIIAYLASLIVVIIGICVGTEISDAQRAVFGILLWVFCVLPILLIPLNLILSKIYFQKLNRRSVNDWQQYFLKNRESAKQESAAMLIELKKFSRATDIYAVLLSLIALCISFCAGTQYEFVTHVPFCFLSMYVFLASFSRIRLPEQTYFFASEQYVDEKDYPALYEQARKAATRVGYEGPIKIALLPDCNAGIAKIGDICSLQLGVILLQVLSEDELYHILLHEFAHLKGELLHSNYIVKIVQWLSNGGTPTHLSSLTDFLFSYSNNVFLFRSFVYMHAVAIQIETAADRSMATYGTPEIAASALLKINYHTLYAWESEGKDFESVFTAEEPPKTFLHQEVESFKQAIEQRSDEWNHLIQSEILSRTASHPTTRMRLEMLGISTFQTVPFADSPQFTSDCQRALDHVENLIYQGKLETYASEREENYLEPLKKINEWENAGQPLAPESYSEILVALRTLGRISDVVKLCDRAIDELSNAASCFAYYSKGCIYLHRYDPEGIELLYHAIENNSNFIDSGLEQIGEFCCLTGRQEDLDQYRQRAVELAQKQHDLYSQMSTLNKGDRLSGEQLPDGMLDSILDHIRSYEQGMIEKIYLIRKTITDEFFVSIFVIRFTTNASPEKRDEILQKTFYYLDTCSDWQFSLLTSEDAKKINPETIPGSCVYSKPSSS